MSEISNTNVREIQKGYKIGAVARITGIPVDRLRIWERRYAVVEPARTASHGRMYSQHQIEKLKLIKRLIDKGDRIGSIANLDMEDLEYRMKVFCEKDIETEITKREPLKVVGLGKSLKLHLEPGLSNTSLYEVDSVFSRQSEFEDHVRIQKPDILIIESAGLVESSIRNIESLSETANARGVVVIYSFASEQVLRNQPGKNWIFLQSPMNSSRLYEAVKSCCNKIEPIENTKQREVTEPEDCIFSEQQLFKISKESAAVKCECPRHITFIIKKLNDFEEYSQSCVVDSTEDSILHKDLYIQTARARSIMENALKNLLETEGIEY